MKETTSETTWETTCALQWQWFHVLFQEHASRLLRVLFCLRADSVDSYICVLSNILVCNRHIMWGGEFSSWSQIGPGYLIKVFLAKKCCQDNIEKTSLNKLDPDTLSQSVWFKKLLRIVSKLKLPRNGLASPRQWLWAKVVSILAS